MYIVFVIVIFCNVFLKCLFCVSCVRRWYEHVDIFIIFCKEVCNVRGKKSAARTRVYCTACIVCTRSSRVTLFVVCDLLLEFGNLLSICFVLGSTCATQSWAPLDERLFP